MYTESTFDENKYQISDVDNKSYLIRRGHNKSPKFLKDSANKLAEINIRVQKLIDYLQQQNTSYSKYLAENYNYTKISEAAYDTRYTTYTVNKDQMHICLRTRDQKENMYDTNILMYVILHELAHMCNYDINSEPIIGHGPEFRKIFKELVNTSIYLKIYDYQDYTKNPVDYCGLKINSQILQ